MAVMNDVRRKVVHGRFRYQAPTEAQKFQLQVAHEHIMALVTFLTDSVDETRDQSVALAKLEDARMAINKAIVIGSN